MNGTKKPARFQFSIAFLLGLTSIAACGLFLVPTLYRQRLTENSTTAELNLSRYFIALGTDSNPGLIGHTKDDGQVAIRPDSCGPSLDLGAFRADGVRALYPVLELLLPRDGKSHVALYLSPQLVADTQFIDELKSELPRYVIFDRSQLRFNQEDLRTP